MIYVILVGLVLSHAATLVAGGWLHYRFGTAVVNTARILEAAVLASKK